MKITECPRDAMQGIKQFIPTELKAEYLNQLLKVGFDTIDFGSFVSPRVVPQMRDTWQVLEAIQPFLKNTYLIAIIPNRQGLENAVQAGGTPSMAPGLRPKTRSPQRN